VQLYQATGGNFMVITVTHDDLEMQLNVVLTSVLGRSWGGTGGGGQTTFPIKTGHQLFGKKVHTHTHTLTN